MTTSELNELARLQERLLNAERAYTEEFVAHSETRKTLRAARGEIVLLQRDLARRRRASLIGLAYKPQEYDSAEAALEAALEQLAELTETVFAGSPCENGDRGDHCDRCDWNGGDFCAIDGRPLEEEETPCK